MQMLGGFLILLGCFGMGLWYRQQFLGRLYTIRELIRIFTEVYREYAETEDAGFLELAEKSFRRQLRMLPLKKEDIEEFLRFAEKEGYADETMQIKSIELSRQGLEHTADMQQREITQKCRLSVGLGAMSGLLILLLLV